MKPWRYITPDGQLTPEAGELAGRVTGDDAWAMELPERPARMRPVEALTQALEAAAARGRPGDPAIILAELPEDWALVDTRATLLFMCGDGLAALLDALEDAELPEVDA